MDRGKPGVNQNGREIETPVAGHLRWSKVRIADVRRAATLGLWSKEWLVTVCVALDLHLDLGLVGSAEK